MSKFKFVTKNYEKLCLLNKNHGMPPCWIELLHWVPTNQTKQARMDSLMLSAT